MEFIPQTKATHTIVKNSLILAVAFVFAKILGAFYRIPLTNILTEEGMGIYQLVFPLYAFLLVVLTSGTSVAITKLVAQNYSQENTKDAKTIFIAGLKITTFFTIGAVLIMIILGGVFAKIQGLENGFWLYLILAPCLLFAGMSSCFKAYFQGKENMVPTSTATVIEQLAKLGFGLLFAFSFLKNGLIAGVFGALLGVLSGEILGLCTTFLFFKKDKDKYDYNKDSIKNITEPDSNISIIKYSLKPMKSIFKICLPVIFASSILPLLFFIDSLIVVNFITRSGATYRVATASYGTLYGVVNSLINMPIVFAAALSASVLPNLSKHDNAEQVHKAKFSCLLAAAVAIPFAILFFVFPDSITRFLYPNLGNIEASNLLRISSVLVFLLSISTVLISIFQSAGKMWQNFFVLLICGTVKYIFVLIFALTKTYTIYVACYLNIGFYLLAFVINSIRFCLYYKTLPRFSTIFILSGLALTTFAACYLFKIFFSLSPFWTLALAGSICFIIFGLFCIFMFKKNKRGKNLTIVKEGG